MNIDIFVFLSSILITMFFIITAKATEKDLEGELLVRDREERKNLLLTSLVNHTDDEVTLSCCLSSCVMSCFYWFLSHTFDNYRNDWHIHLHGQDQAKKQSLPPDLILVIASFLDYKDQLSLSHVNKGFRSTIDEKFWERQVVKQNYLIWDASLPKAKVFFANYYYQRGFGRDPDQVEKIVESLEDITFIPSLKLAKKSLVLGFPKGKENYKQIQHKITILNLEKMKKSMSNLENTLLNKKERLPLFRGSVI